MKNIKQIKMWAIKFEVNGCIDAELVGGETLEDAIRTLRAYHKQFDDDIEVICGTSERSQSGYLEIIVV